MSVIVICGSRDFTDYKRFKSDLDEHFVNLVKSDALIISGGADGADKMAEIYAEENNIAFREMPAAWASHGKKAGVLRNIEMAELANEVIAFWDGTSPGTAQMIKYCMKKEIPITVYETN